MVDKNSGEILDKLKAKYFNATSLSTYDFSTPYTLPHNLIKDKLIDLIERTFNREGSHYLACSNRNTYFTLEKLKKSMILLKCCNAQTFLMDNILFDLAPSCIDKKLEFLWALIVLSWLQIYSSFVMRGIYDVSFLMISRLILLMLITLDPDIWTIF